MTHRIKTYEPHSVGELRFLRHMIPLNHHRWRSTMQLADKPYTTNPGGIPRLRGWLGNYHDTSFEALGLVRVTTIKPLYKMDLDTGLDRIDAYRVEVQRLGGAELVEALTKLGYTLEENGKLTRSL